MKKETSTLLRKIRQYSALSGSMLAVTGLANAQINYTDIDPDVTLLSSNQDNLEIDLNNDGTSDFNFFANYYTFGGGTTAKFINAVMQPYTTGNPNGFVGAVGTPATGVYFGYVHALANGANIGPAQDFFELGDIVYNSQFFLPGLLTVYNGTYSLGYWAGGVTDHFVGVKFSPDGTAIHYGWIRCDVAADASSITIKDYAWDETADQAIVAGDAGGTGVNGVDLVNPITVFGYEGMVTILLKDGKTEGAVVRITNLLGQTILSQELSAAVSRVNLNDFSKGMYLVTVERGGDQFTRKVSFR